MIALLCATPREMASLRALMTEVESRDAPPGTRLREGLMAGVKVLLYATGVGKVASAAAARFLLDHYELEMMIGLGIAGALQPDLEIGDLVVASELVHGDVGVAHSRGFKATGPGLCEEGGISFTPTSPVSDSMLAAALSAAAEAGLPCRSGRILTCDQVVLDPELRRHLGESFRALAVEMEGAAAAQVAHTEGVPFLAVRAISDEITHDFAGFEKVLPYRGQARRHLWGRRFLLLLAHPSVLARAREMSSGVEAALASLASFVEPLLKSL